MKTSTFTIVAGLFLALMILNQVFLYVAISITDFSIRLHYSATTEQISKI